MGYGLYQFMSFSQMVSYVKSLNLPLKIKIFFKGVWGVYSTKHGGGGGEVFSCSNLFSDNVKENTSFFRERKIGFHVANIPSRFSF